MSNQAEVILIWNLNDSTSTVRMSDICLIPNKTRLKFENYNVSLGRHEL